MIFVPQGLSLNPIIKDMLLSVSRHNLVDFVFHFGKHSWELYNDIDRDENSNSRDTILKCWGNRISCMAFAYCKPSNPLFISNYDLNCFLQDYFNLDESFIHDKDSSKNEAFQNAFDEISDFKGLESSFVEHFVLHTFASRAIRSQRANTKSSSRWVLRNYQISKRFLENGVEKEFKNTLKKRLKLYMKMDLGEMIRVGYLALGTAANSRPLGKLQMWQESVVKDVEQYGVTLDAYKILAERWSWKSDQLSDFLADDFTFSSNPDVKYFPSPLVKNPILNFGTSSSDFNFFIPSPWDLMTKLCYSCEDYLLDVVHGNEKEKSVVTGGLGDEYSKWMMEFSRDCVGPETVLDLEPYRKSTDKQIADMLLVKDDVCIIVEFKRTIGPLTAKTYLAPDETVDTMVRIRDAANQIHSTKQLITKGVIELTGITKYGHIVCCNQQLFNEGTLFIELMENSNLSTKLNVFPLCVLDSDEFEEYLHRFKVKELYERINISHSNLATRMNLQKRPFESDDNVPFHSVLYDQLQDEVIPWHNSIKRER